MDFPLVLGYGLLPFTSSQPRAAMLGKAQGRGGQCRGAWSFCKAPPEHPQRVSQSSEAPGLQAIPLVESAAGPSSQTSHAPSPEHHLQQGFEVSKLSPLACRCGKAPAVLTPLDKWYLPRVGEMQPQRFGCGVKWEEGGRRRVGFPFCIFCSSSSPRLGSGGRQRVQG